MLSTLTIDDTGNDPVVVYPFRYSKLRQPLLRMPEGSDEVLFLFDIVGFAPPVPSAVAQSIARNTAWVRRARELGGKAHNVGSTNLLTPEDRKTYFSPIWPAVLLAELAFDPQNVLTPGQQMFPSSFGC